ncbi:DUF2235 domain-containing protein [Rapidithrix thailandica]|uniref:DUF2235 domain-containing protein n=1 Tax=Rapidithrix thailandica TaxID=413964 RepID=A0AAW9RS27_9BACT
MSVPRKSIVICIDGTWNYAGQKDEKGVLANTNVYRFFNLLAWNPPSTPSSPEADLHAYQLAATKQNLKADGFKRFDNAKGETRQVALYYNGVGNPAEHGFWGRLVGGLLGHGANKIRNEAFYDLARLYHEGDSIYVFGFSRGAAIARMLCNHIRLYQLGKQGLMKDMVNYLPFRFFSFKKRLASEQAAPVKLLAVWDTVAAFGIPKNLFGIPFQRINLFKNLTISPNIEQALHMLSVDDQRDAFQPTLMSPDLENKDRITQIWFPGIHADIGGGYAEKALSDITLKFLLDYLLHHQLDRKDTEQENPGIAFRQQNLQDFIRTNLHPDPEATMHIEDSLLYQKQVRDIPHDGFLHQSVIHRFLAKPMVYYPANVIQYLKALKERESFARLIDENTLDLAFKQEHFAKASTIIEKKIWIDQERFVHLKK